MERLILDYTVTGQHTLTLNNADAFSQFTKDNIRLIIDCTTQEPIVTPLDRTALDSVAYSSGTHKLTITLKSTSPVLTVGGELSVKIDDQLTFQSDYSKEKTVNDTLLASVFRFILNTNGDVDIPNRAIAAEFTYYRTGRVFKYNNSDKYEWLAVKSDGNILIGYSDSIEPEVIYDSMQYDGGETSIHMVEELDHEYLQLSTIAQKSDLSSLAKNSTVAKESTLGTSSDTASSATIFGKIANLLSTWNTWISGAWATLVSNVTAIKAKTDNIGTPSDTSSASTLFGKVAAIPTTQISGYALQGTDPTATNTKILEEIATASTQVNLIEITSAQITAMINRIINN